MLLLSLPEIPRSVSVWRSWLDARRFSRDPATWFTFMSSDCREAPLFTDRPASCLSVPDMKYVVAASFVPPRIDRFVSYDRWLP